MPSLTVYPPGGEPGFVVLGRFPFRIGRQPENELVLTDQRISREHARIIEDRGTLLIEDSGSRHGVFVNGSAVKRHPLAQGDTIEFGLSNGYRLIFDETQPTSDPMERLRDMLEMFRALDRAFEPQRVLDSVVDAALRVIGAERGFLFLQTSGELEMVAARDKKGAMLDESCLRVPRRMIVDALRNRRDAYAVNFDSSIGIPDAGQTVTSLELRSSVFVPLPRAGGLLYFDSRAGRADLAMGNRELLETLAIKASSVIASIQSIEGERQRRKLEEELSFGRAVQQSLLPRQLPSNGWLRAAGSSRPSRAVGGDYFDILSLDDDTRSIVMADVSGKGLGAALLASLLQGATLSAGAEIAALFRKINQFLLDRTHREKFATMFLGTLRRSGELQYANAGHCAPLIVRRDGTTQILTATGVPLGLVEEANHELKTIRLAAGDKLVAYSDGFADVLPKDAVSGLQSLDATAFEAALRERCVPCEPDDDQTLLVVEYLPD